MILQQLAEDYERILRYGIALTEDEEDAPESFAPPSMYADKLIRGEIELNSDGKFRAYSLLGGAKDKKGKDIGKYLPAPFIVRTVNVSPLLLTDTPAYVLGLETDAKNAAKKHEAFKALVKLCAEETGESGTQAVAKFLDWWDAAPLEDRSPELLALNANDIITFSVRGERPMDHPAVQKFWAKICGAGAKTALTQCLVCGEQRPAIESMPLMVKGIPGGQTSGTALVSANSDVFESYGMKRAATSPICAECAERFGKSLNSLLKNDATRKRVGGSIYVFWTQKGTFATANLLGNPQPDFVRALIESVSHAKRQGLEDTTPFFGLMLSATAARAVVRDWMITTVGRVNLNVANWFEMQEDVPDAYGQRGSLVADWVLAACIYRQKTQGRFSSEDVEKRIPPLLMRTALHGEPLPEDLLYRAVLRNRAENNVTYERAVLITLVLKSRGETLDFAPLPKENTDLNPDEPKPELSRASGYARQCGRLLAVLEELQGAFARSEGRKINATLVDRFYSSASSAPGTVFGTLLADAQAHLTKLRKNNQGAYTNLQIQMETEMEGMTEFPLTLNMKQQALFSLGYYHKRAELRAARTEAGEANRKKKADKQAALDTESDAPILELDNENDTEEQGNE